MDIFEIRKANLIRLIGSRRKGACAEKWEMAPAHLSQVLSNKTAKNLGEDVARRIEQKEGLPHGWLDTLQLEAIAERTGSYSPAQMRSAAEENAEALDGGATSEPSQQQSGVNMAALLNLQGKATPRSLEVLKRIEKAAIEGRLQEADLIALEGIATRFEQLNTEKP